MTDLADLLFSVLFHGSVQLAIFGSLLLLHERLPVGFLSSKTICRLTLLLFFVSAIPESALPDLIPAESSAAPVFFDLVPVEESSAPPEGVLSQATSAAQAHFPVFIPIWLAGFLGILVALLGTAGRAHWQLVRTPALIDPSLQNTLERLKRKLKIWVPVTLCENSEIASPTLYGWIHPRIFLPESRQGEAADPQVEIVLAHECIHIRERDILWQWILTGFVALYWFHPVSWLLLRFYRERKEICCDEAVLREFGFSRENYANALVTEARKAGRKGAGFRIPVAAGIAERTNSLLSRVEKIMNPMKIHPSSRFITPILCATMLLSGFLLEQIQAEPEGGITETERSEIKEQSEEILAAIWNRSDTASGYAYASTHYKSQVTLDEYRAAMESPQIKSIKIKSRKLIDLAILDGNEAVDGGKNVQLLFRTEIEGTSVLLNESLFLINEDGNWLMTGHWIRP